MWQNISHETGTTFEPCGFIQPILILEVSGPGPDGLGCSRCGCCRRGGPARQRHIPGAIASRPSPQHLLERGPLQPTSQQHPYAIWQSSWHCFGTVVHFGRLSLQNLALLVCTFKVKNVTNLLDKFEAFDGILQISSMCSTQQQYKGTIAI